MPRIRHLAGAIAAGLLFSTAAAATDFSKVIVIGDSLSDAGNIAKLSGSPVPLRFTTNPGTTAAENVAAALKLPVSASLSGGTDYAFGGAGLQHNSPGTPAGVPMLPQQFQMYLAANGGAADSKALYQVWGGANDIFYLTSSSTNPNVLAAGAISAAQTEVGLLGQMQAAGAKYVVVYNLPDIGKTPSGMAGGPASSAGATQLSLAFNGVLSAGITQLSNNGLNVIPVNTFQLLNEVIANPSAYGFTNVTTPACNGSSVQCGPAGSGLPFSYAAGTNNTYLFADGVHPTTATHAMLGQYVVSVIQAPGQISMLGEAPLAAAAAQTRAIRNEMMADAMGSDTRFFANVDYAHQRFDQQSSSPKTTSNNVNLTVGADVRASEHVSMGVALGIGQHNADFTGGGYKLQDISGLGYLMYHNGGGYIGGYVNYAQSNFTDIDRRIHLGAATRSEGGKTDGNRLGGGATGGWWFNFDAIRTGPFATVEWQTVKVNAYSEGGNDSTAMWFGRQQRDALISTLGWRLQGHWQAGGMMLAPYAEVAWNHDSKADPRSVTAGVVSMPGQFALTGFVPDKTWGTADVGVSAQFSDNVTGWVGYSGRFSDDSQKYNSLNLGVKVGF